VFWVHASNTARFEQSFRDIADRVKIFGRQDPQANVFKLVHDWLRQCKQRWLLVLDNVDDARFLLDRLAASTNANTTSKPLREYLSHCERGSILITTRNKEAALKLVEQLDIVFVEPMDKTQALALFEKKLEAQGVNSDVAELATELEYMPLAIVQAAAYISQSAPRCSVAKYLEQFRRSDGEKTSLLNHEAGQLRRDREAKNSIIITWQISFEHLRQNKSSAADLLSLMSFFDRQGIPEALVHGDQGAKRASIALETREGSTRRRLKQILGRAKSKPRAQKEQKESDGCRTGFEDDVVALRNLCLISVDANGSTFEMHSLVQLATRRWLTANGKLERWKQQFVSNLHAAFPTGEYENWAACRALYAHAKAAVGQQPKDESSIAEWATVLYRAAWYAERMGNIADAKMLATKAMKARKKVLGQKHEDTVWSVAMVGLAYKLGGRWDEAEKLQVQVMETFKTKLGADHPSTLTSMANLASTYSNQGRWDEAEKLEVQVMETSKTKLGADHPNTLTSMNNLAYTQRSLGREVEAIELMRECVQLSQQRFRPNHPNSLSFSATLAQWEAEHAVADLEIV
jgi:tetratricopeptide (TPR) repeat protein